MMSAMGGRQTLAKPEIGGAPDPSTSEWRLAAGTLSLCCLRPPFEILGEADEVALEPFARLADRPAVMVERLANWTYRESARDNDHSHFAQRAVPGRV